MDGKLRKEKLSFPRVIVHSKNVQECGFARSGGSHDGDKLSLDDIKSDLAQDVREPCLRLDGFFDIS